MIPSPLFPMGGYVQATFAAIGTRQNLGKPKLASVMINWVCFRSNRQKHETITVHYVLCKTEFKRNDGQGHSEGRAKGAICPMPQAQGGLKMKKGDFLGEKI